MKLQDLLEISPSAKSDLKVTDIEVDGVDRKDYPDFSDAYVSKATWKETGKELTDDELDKFTDEYPDLVNDLAHEKYR